MSQAAINKEKLKSEVHECDKALSLVRALDDHCRCSNSVLVSDNRDAVMGMGNMIMEMGLQKSAGIINHDITGDSFEFTDSHEKIGINLSEGEKRLFINGWNPDIILGDGVLEDMFKPNSDILCCQVSNPNINRLLLLDQTPYVGFKGVIHLCEIICNSLLSKKGACFPIMNFQNTSIR